MKSDPSTQALSIEYQTETYRAEFDSREIAPSMAVVEVVALVTNTEPIELEPLHESVDTDSIDRMGSWGSSLRQEGDQRIEFEYLGYDVTVKSYGVIEVEPRSVDGG